MIHLYLKITSTFFLFPFLFFIIKKSKKFVEYLMFHILIHTFIFSQIFWNNPIQNSIIHKIDSVFAKTTITIFIWYTIFYKSLPVHILYSYYLLVLLLTYLFYMSNYYSTQEWCSSSHIWYHGMGHICAVVCALYVFY